jgi:phage N-6-adenine-methyltransferase
VKPSDLYETPPEFFDYWNRIFQFNLDPCCEPETAKCGVFITKERDGLAADWKMLGILPGMRIRAFCNPPYSQGSIPKWIAKAKQEQANGIFTFMLLPADTSTKWYQELAHDRTVTLLLPPGRLKFLYNGKRKEGPKFGNLIALMWPKELMKNRRAMGNKARE